MTSLIQALPAENYRRERWRNGHGWTRQILRQPDEDAFHWRTSIAEISQDTLFSLYPGYRRIQVLLHGQGLQLGFADGRRTLLEPPCSHIGFGGDEVVACHLVDGPVQVFNAMWDPARIDARLLHRPVVGPMVFLHEAGVEWFVHLLAGQLQLRGDATDIRLAQGDSLRLRAAPSQRLVLDGGGEILLLRLTRHSPEQDQQQSALDKKGINTS
ncbi:HutD family protein [Denitratimonas sp. CY0512]|uniref:HutD/Ves family protein n=1 Tax=Denitratimonas sp. CY0512 TaxID=3131940 RepID=UPI0030A76745